MLNIFGSLDIYTKCTALLVSSDNTFNYDPFW